MDPAGETPYAIVAVEQCPINFSAKAAADLGSVGKLLFGNF